MEEIKNLITGCFVETEQVYQGEVDSEEEEEDGDMAFGFRDMSSMGGGKNMASYSRPKFKTGNLIDLATGKLQRVRAPFHLPDQWWQVTVLRTKMSKDKHKEPKDQHALCYRFRDDPKRFKDQVVQLFISKVGSALGEGDIQGRFHQIRTGFETYLRSMGQEADLDLLNLEERLTAYSESLPEDQRECPDWFKTMIISGQEFRYIQLSQAHPQILHYGPQLFPFHFSTLITFEPDDLEGLAEAIEEEPGNLAFKAIVSKKYNIAGCETNEEALVRSGLMSKVPQHVRDAIKIYEYLKRESKDAGHTYIQFDKILDVLGPVCQQLEEALEFLNTNKVTKTQMDGPYRIVYLMHLWQAENKIAKGLYSLQQREEKQAWQLEVDFDRDDFETIRQDADQLRAAKLITTQPVVAISGKGGCGKTYVVTKVISAASAKRSGHSLDDSETQPPDNYDDMDTQQPTSDEDIFDKGDAEEKKMPEEVKLLLTAPTGKAANLLGKRADMPSFTLHQVIWGFPPQNGAEWKHKDINILVVDECSLVSVTTFSYLLDILLRNSQLKHVVLLGDIRQLPSIEPGNFLSDTFRSLDRIGCAVELRTNHRAESQLIVDNATAISSRMYPRFDNDQFVLRRLPESNPGSTGNDYLCQDINEDVTKLLLHEKLQSDYNSQFISFTRRVCDGINDLCCKKYSGHRTQEHGKHVFRTKDKICCTKNGYVEVYREEHGLMSCDKKTQDGQSGSTQPSSQSQGGMDRSSNPADESVNEADESKSEDNKSEKMRLCNGEIFFILNEVEKQDNRGSMRTFLQLSDKDPEDELMFWVDKKQLRKTCKIRHAWARTIHTFQGSETDHVVYIVGSKSRRQNWQHVYTAITRGRKAVFIVSCESTLREAIKRSEIKRQTGLRKQLVEKFQKNPNFNATLIGQKSLLNHTMLATQPGPSRLAVQTAASRQKLTSTAATGETVKPTKSIMDYFAKGNNSRPIGDVGNLNTTQQVTDVLSSLAAEHDDEEIEEFDSDDSDSLLTKIKPRHKTSADLIDDSSNDSGGSDSILGSAPLKKHPVNSGRPAWQNSGAAQNTGRVDNRLTENLKRESSRKDKDSDSTSSDSQEMSQSLLSTQTETRNNDTTLTFGRKTGRLSRKKKNDSKTVHSEVQQTSFLTSTQREVPPAVRQHIASNPNHQHFQHLFHTPGSKLEPSTSSPRFGADTLNFSRIRSGNSPIIPGYEGPDFTRVTSPVNGNSKRSPGYSDDIPEEICNPKSNESQWSDINDSDYMKMDETSFFQLSQPKTSVQSNNHAQSAKPFTTLRRSLLSKTPQLSNRGSNGSFQTPEQPDISTNSLWSEADDEQYISLDLSDIQNMTKPDYHGNGAGISTEHVLDVPRDSHTDSYSRRRSPQINIPDTPPSPTRQDVFESPPRSRSHQLSPGVKRQTVKHDGDLVIKRRQTNDGSTVSPLKRSLAKLEFK